jgi:septum formation protein
MVQKNMLKTVERIILASSSPRRRAYFEELGIEFEVFVADVDETPVKGEDPLTYAARMAGHKCEAVMERFPGSWVVAADTIVFLESTILGKPRSREDSVRMLMMLSGREHEVATTFGVGCRKKKIFHMETVVTRVTFASFSKKTAQAYAATGEPADKAGAYGIQGKGALLVKEIKGSYTNVVGLPLCEVVEVLKSHGIVNTK